ncbi:hypothetical protein [Streptomyces sp. AC555_RSS877]|uniref:hypothetical protein n=1 Tax=Streptomyces sp. AC555_RSS877 TaxID=2823688 RepID=UPI001C2812A9|nr:hypothetical protein [Streptomyces sp. AC555_RSS877]
MKRLAPAPIQAGMSIRWRLLVIAVKRASAISASDSSVPHRHQTAAVYSIGVQASSPITAMAALTEAFIRTGTENPTPRTRQAGITSPHIRPGPPATIN